MILLDQIVEVLRRSDFGPLAAPMFAEDFPRRPMGRLVAIKRDGPRQSALALERPPEKGFGCRDIPLGAEHKIDRLSLFVDRTIEVSPAAFDLYVGFIDPPGGASSAREAVPPLFEFRDIGAEGPTARKRTLRKRFFPENAASDRRIRRFSGFWRYYCVQ